MIYFTSDEHFGHNNILKYCPERYKQFQTVYSMDEAIMERWNSRVNKNDIVINLGDVAFDNFDILDKLNGTKFLVLGNHDIKNKKKLAKWFKVYDELIVVDNTYDLVLCHYPMKEWPQKYHDYIHLHGHSHGKLYYDTMAVDVGVDCWNYTPITLDEIKERISERKERE